MSLRARAAWRSVAFAALLTAAACGGVTKVHGIRDSTPGLTPHGPFHSTLLVVEGRLNTERALVRRTVVNGLAYLGVTVLPETPGDESSANSVLTIRRNQASEETIHVPATPGYISYERSYLFPSRLSIATWNSGTPAQTHIKEHGVYQATLTHRGSSEPLWSATVDSSGDTRAD